MKFLQNKQSKSYWNLSIRGSEKKFAVLITRSKVNSWSLHRLLNNNSKITIVYAWIYETIFFCFYYVMLFITFSVEIFKYNLKDGYYMPEYIRARAEGIEALDSLPIQRASQTIP